MCEATDRSLRPRPVGVSASGRLDDRIFPGVFGNSQVAIIHRLFLLPPSLGLDGLLGQPGNLLVPASAALP